MREMLLLIAGLLAVAGPIRAMNNYDDPRVLISYMDRSLVPSRDILRLATRVSADDRLVFQVKMRGEPVEPRTGDYIVLQISHGALHEIVVPIDPALGDTALVYEQEVSFSGSRLVSTEKGLRGRVPGDAFRTRRISNGVEISVALDWIDYSVKLGYDAYTVQGSPSGDSFRVDAIYDQAAKGEQSSRLHSPITLLNNLCATRKVNPD